MRRVRRRRGKGTKPPPRSEPDELVTSSTGVAVRRFGNDRGTPERARHDPVAVVDIVVDNRRARVARAKDMIARMQSNGTINGSMVWAARRFQGDFDTAGLDPLRAGPLERRSKGTSDDSATTAARERIANATRALGGHGSPAALVVWFVVGGGYTIKDWALRERWGAGRSLNEETPGEY